jgi:uncharacterized protein (TIGR02569 family)
MGERVLIVPSTVRKAFGLDGEAVALPGGEGVTVRIGDVVLKRVHDRDEAEWTGELQSRMVEDGFRLARPVPTLAGRWTHGNWSATKFIPGLRPVAPAWHAVTAIGLRFSDAAEVARDGQTGPLPDRTHRWAVADRAAWDEASVDLVPEATEVYFRLGALLGDPPADRQLVHGDLTGNVCTDVSAVPVVLDFSPYLRPRKWAAAIVIADAVLWHGAEPSLAASFAVTESGRDLLGRALIFRMVAEQLAAEPRHDAHLEPYRRVLSILA